MIGTLIHGTVFAILWFVDRVLRWVEDVRHWAWIELWCSTAKISESEIGDDFHVALCFDDDKLFRVAGPDAVQALGRLCVWCAEEGIFCGFPPLNVGVAHVTLFDISGVVKEMSADVAEYVKANNVGRSIAITVGKKRLPENSTLEPRTTVVRLLCAKEGPNTIVAYARAVAEGRLLAQRPLNRQEVERMLDQDPLNLMLETEPDVLIVFAECLTIGPLPPWQLRLTQMFCEPSTTSFTRPRLRKMIRVAAGTEKRFGR